MSEKRYNNFDSIRIIAATLVVFSHSFGLLKGASYQDPLFKITKYFSIGDLSVAIFFAISGYLITQSYQRSPNFYIFLHKRLIRIFPGLLFVIAFTCFLIFPFFIDTTLQNYFNSQTLWSYIGSSLFFFINEYQFKLVGVFTNNPIPWVVNGSLWTLSVEFFYYLLIPIIFITKVKKLQILTIIVLLLSTSFLTHFFLVLNSEKDQFFINLQSALPILATLPTQKSFYFGIYFITGVLLNFLNLKRQHTYIGIFSFICGLIVLTNLDSSYFMLHSALLSFGIIVIGNSYSYILSKIVLFGDISYGIYIYSFPLQQAIVSVIIQQKLQVSVSMLFIVSLIVILPVAILSWQYIEKPMLRYKKAN